MIKRDVNDEIHNLVLESIRLRSAASSSKCSCEQGKRIREYQDKLWKKYKFLSSLTKAMNELNRKELEKEKRNGRKNNRRI